MRILVRVAILFLLGNLISAPVHSQEPAPMLRVGVLLPTTPELSTARLEAFREGLRQNGYVEGKTIALEIRYAPNDAKQQARFAAELVALPVNVILTSATGPTQVAKDATTTIPIVFAIAGDAVASGFIASFERPGGNITGVPDSGPAIAGKRLELLKDVIPGVSRVAVIGNAAPKQQAGAKKSLEATAQKLAITLLFPDVRSAADIPTAFEAANTWKAEAYVTLSQSLTSNAQRQIVDLASKGRRPLLFHRPEAVEAGALMSLNDDNREIFRSAAGLVAKILKGGSPGTMPVVPSANPEMVINLKTAQTLGIVIPPAVLKRATRVVK